MTKITRPTPIADQLSTLRAQVAHRDPAVLGRAVLKLLGRYRTEAGDSTVSKATVAAYTDILGKVPVWAAVTACDEWHTGKYSAGEKPSAIHPPTPAQIFEAAKSEAAYATRQLELLEQGGGHPVRYRPWRPGDKTVGEIEEERERAERAAKGEKPETPESRAKIAEGWEKLRSDLIADNAERRLQESPRDRAKRESYDTIAAMHRGKRPIGRANAPIPAEDRADDLPRPTP